MCRNVLTKKIVVCRLISMSQGLLNISLNTKISKFHFFSKPICFFSSGHSVIATKKSMYFWKIIKAIHSFILSFAACFFYLHLFVRKQSIVDFLNNNRHIHFSSVTFTNKKIFIFVHYHSPASWRMKKRLKTTRNFLKNKNCTKFLRCHWDSGFRKTQQS